MVAGLVAWRNFLKKFFGIDPDISKLRIPDRPEGFRWPILMPKGLTLKKIVREMKKHMDVSLGIGIDKVTSDRNPDTDYVVFVRDRVEADEELAGRSADDLEFERINGITLPERLLLEFFYWRKTRGQHLDKEYSTLCSGSRYTNDDRSEVVPHVEWDLTFGCGVCVSWDDLKHRYSRGRARRVVS